MVVLDLATIITPLKYNFLHYIFVVSVILNLNFIYIFTGICVFIHLFIYLFIYLCI